MSPYFIPGIVVDFLLALACYTASENWIVTGVVLAVYLLITLLGLVPMLDKYVDRKRRSHEAYRFINSYIISLSATHSYGLSFDSATEGATGKLKEVAEAIQEMDPLEKAKYMEDYFSTSIYTMFLRVLDLYANQGGDVLRLSGSLLEEVTRVEETNRQKEKTGSRNLLAYLLLWAVSTGIMVFLRFGLSSFFTSIKRSPVYLGCLTVYFLFMLVSLLIYGSFYTEIRVMEIFKKGGRSRERD